VLTTGIFDKWRGSKCRKRPLVVDDVVGVGDPVAVGDPVVVGGPVVVV